MQHRRRHLNTTRRFAIAFKLFAILLIVLFLLCALDTEVRPVILTMAGYQARVASIIAINDAVLERMAQEDPHLELVEIQHDSDGKICAIEANTIEINRLKSELTVAVGQKLAEIQRTKISIPLGTLLGWQIFAGRGPDIGFKIVPASFVHSDIKSTLISAGINQTRHQIILAFTVEMTAIIPGYTTSVTVTTEVCVAETLIVGEVPQLFAPGNE